MHKAVQLLLFAKLLERRLHVYNTGVAVKFILNIKVTQKQTWSLVFSTF